MNIDLYKNIYLIGIGGIGMSALARYFNANSKYVYGYDIFKSELCVELEDEGINIHYNDKVNEIPEVINSCFNDVLIIYTPAISNENKLLRYFIDKGIRIYKRAEILGLISKKVFTIAVAGTHGKTTTSTILAHILKVGGNEVTAFLGGISRNYNTNLLLADNRNILIVEADEYDRSFLHLYSDIAIITSVDADHLDIYKNKDDLEKAFVQFASQIKHNGLLLLEESITVDFPVPSKGKKLTYSAKSKADYFAENMKVKNGKMCFDMTLDLDIKVNSNFFMRVDKDDNTSGNHLMKNIVLQMPGTHNISNALAASAVACYLGLDYDFIYSGLRSFKGINRRFDMHLNSKKIAFIDDYAHHPEAIRVTIQATKLLFPQRELTVVFQPHLYSRTKDFANEFSISLREADDLVLLDIYPAREKPIDGVSSEMLLDLCTNFQKEVCSKDILLSILKRKKIDVLLTLGAGDVSTLVQPIKHMLN